MLNSNQLGIPVFTILAGLPAKTQYSSEQSLLTVALAPIVTLLVMLIFPNKIAPGPMYTLSPIWGASLLPALAPIFTHACNLQFEPILACGFIIIVP